MATPSSILAWEILWTEEPGRLLSLGLQRVRHDLATKQQQHQLIGSEHMPSRKRGKGCCAGLAVWSSDLFSALRGCSVDLHHWGSLLAV